MHDWLQALAWKDVWKEFKDLQTLIAGLIALIGAWATIAGVKRQIRFSEELEVGRRRNEAFAARAVMPMALSEMSSYAEICLTELSLALRVTDHEKKHQHLRNIPSPPEASIGNFKEAIRFADEPTQRKLAELLSWYQVHEARLRQIRSADQIGINLMEVQQAIVDAAELKSRADNLFAWARRESDGETRLLGEQIVDAVKFRVHNLEDYPDLKVLLDVARRKRRS